MREEKWPDTQMVTEISSLRMSHTDRSALRESMSRHDDGGSAALTQSAIYSSMDAGVAQGEASVPKPCFEHLASKSESVVIPLYCTQCVNVHTKPVDFVLMDKYISGCKLLIVLV